MTAIFFEFIRPIDPDNGLSMVIIVVVCMLRMICVFWAPFRAQIHRKLMENCAAWTNLARGKSLAKRAFNEPPAAFSRRLVT